MNKVDAEYRRTNYTYRELDRVLRSFGFTSRLLSKEPPALRYEHKGTGAIISMPPLPEAERVLDYHLAAARATLDDYGIAEPKVFNAELEKAG
jgi:hypothetical protein